jgi:tetratricopeptide (TPR) repeat protein
MPKPRSLALPLLLLLAIPASAAAADAPSDGCGPSASIEEAEKVLHRARDRAAVGDAEGTEKAIEDMPEAGRQRADYVIRAGAWLDRVGARAEARKQWSRAVELAGRDASGAGRLHEVAALLRLGREDDAEAKLDAVQKGEDSYRAFACHFISVAQAMSASGQPLKAVKLLSAVRAARPDARSVHDALVGAAFDSRDDEAIASSLKTARARFPKDVAFAVRQANHIKTRGERDEARSLLEELLLQGETSPYLLGELLGLVSGGDRAKEHLPRYVKMMEAHPGLPTLPMFVGVMNHYLGNFAESTKHLESAGELIESEPRVAMYLAMNYFRLGNHEKSERLIEIAARAGTPDPDVFYCHAIINVRNDPAGSVRDLERYMALTGGRPDVNESKQKRVRQTMDLLKGCVDAAGEKETRACVEREVFEKARALAFEEHLAPMREERAGGKKGSATGGKAGLGDGARGPGPYDAGGGTGLHRVVGIGLLLGLGLVVLVIWMRRRRRP